MARYTSTIPTQKSPQELLSAIQTYLTNQGFKQIDPQQNIWQKGMGLLLGPQYIQFAAQPGGLQLQAWIKFALLPGVYLGEMGTDGFFAFIPKSKLKARVAEIEKIAR